MSFGKFDYFVAVIFAVWVLILASWAIFVVHINKNHEESVRNIAEARRQLVMANSEEKRVDLEKCVNFIKGGTTNGVRLVRAFDTYYVEYDGCVVSNGMMSVWMPCVEK